MMYLHFCDCFLLYLSELNVNADEGKNAEEWMIDMRAKHAAASQC